MVTEVVDYVVGVATHRDEHVLAVVAAPLGTVVAQRMVAATAGGYGQALRFAQQHAEGARVWAVEGAGHYGAGLARYLSEHGETVLEVGRAPRGARRRRGQGDERDAGRAAPAPRRSEPRRCRSTSATACSRARESAAKRCGSCCSPVAAPSTSVARRSCSCAA